MAASDITMLKIDKTLSENSLTFSLEGRLDSTTAPQLETEIKTGLNGVKDLVFDMSALEFISSAGLRVLLLAQKTMRKQGTMIIKRLVPEVLKVFEVTGFKKILTIE